LAKPELGTKRLCPNCGAKYYDLNHDPIVCPKCNALFATGAVATRRDTARPADDSDDELETEDEGVELVTLDEADGDSDDTVVDDDIDVDDDDVTVDADDDVLVDDEDSDDEVSDVVRGSGEDDDEH